MGPVFLFATILVIFSGPAVNTWMFSQNLSMQRL
jgi:hypothetical protein